MEEKTLFGIVLSVVTEQFKVLKNGNVSGNVYRLQAKEPVPVYDSPMPNANIMRRLKPGCLLVGYSDPGKMRQINTADQLFGYIRRTVTLLPVQGLDAEGLYDPERRAAVESALPPLDQMGSAYVTEQTRNRRNQYCFMMAFAMVILLGMVTTALIHSHAVPVK